jgi:hypothetical protein
MTKGLVAFAPVSTVPSTILITMKKHYLTAVLLLLNWNLFAQCRLIDLPTPTNPLPNSAYRLVFNDEFSYADSTALWQNRYWDFLPNNVSPAVWLGGGTDQFAEINEQGQVTIAQSNGESYLKITAEELASPTSVTLPDGTVRPITFKSGAIRFKHDLFTQLGSATNLPSDFAGLRANDPSRAPSEYGYTHGIYEIRCKMPKGTGTYQAFWLYNGKTEIDVFEGDKDKKSFFNNVIRHYEAHIMDPAIACQAWFTKESPRGLDDDFHVYTVVWAPEKVTFFFDGREVRTVSNTNIPTGAWAGAQLYTNLAVTKAGPGINYSDWPLIPGTNLHTTEMLIDYIRVYQPTSQLTQVNGQYAANPQSPVFPPFKTDYGWQRTELETTPPTDRRMSPLPGCVSTSKITGQVVYAGPDGILRRYYPLGNGTYQYEEIQPSWLLPEMRVLGDVVVADPWGAQHTQIFYKGMDERIQYLYQDPSSGAWGHDWASPVGTPSVSTHVGALAVANSALIFYRDANNRVNKLQWQGSWQHELLPLDPAAIAASGSDSYQKVDGDIITDGTKAFYAGADGRIQCYLTNGGPTDPYYHLWIDTDWSNVNNSHVSNQYGALASYSSTAMGAGLYYRGKNDNLIHDFHFQPGVGWQHNYLTQDQTQYLVPVWGKIEVSSEGKVFYRGRENKLQFYTYSGGSWHHDWPSSWLYLSPSTISTDNFSLGAASAPLFFQNDAQFVSQLRWAQCETELCTVQYANSSPFHDTGSPVYKTAKGKNGQKQQEVNREDDSSQGLMLYPNPVNSILHLTLNGAAPSATLTISDLQGRTIQSVNYRDGKLDVSTLASGTYLITMDDGQRNYHQKFVKQ